MKLKKVLAATVASALTASVLAISANAALWVPDGTVTDDSGNVLGTLTEQKQLLDEEKNVIGTLADDCISVVDADGNVIGKCADQQPAPGCTIGGNYLIQIYNEGNEEEGKPPTDYGIDVTQIGSLTFYLEMVHGADKELGVDVDMYDPALDAFGGSVIYSANGGTIGGSSSDSPAYKEGYTDELGNTVPPVTMFDKYNWPSNQWWGIPEEGDSAAGDPNIGDGSNTGTVAYDQKLHLECIRKFAYSLTYDIANDTTAEDIRWPAGGTCYQVGLQEWGNDFSLNLKVMAMVAKDDSGNIMLAFDGLGNKIEEADLNAIIDELSQPYVPATPEDTEAPAETEPAVTEGNDNADNAENTTAATTTAAPASSSSDSGNMTMIIVIIVVVVVVIVAVVVVIMMKKKKN